MKKQKQWAIQFNSKPTVLSFIRDEWHRSYAEGLLEHSKQQITRTAAVVFIQYITVVRILWGLWFPNVIHKWSVKISRIVQCCRWNHLSFQFQFNFTHCRIKCENYGTNQEHIDAGITQNLVSTDVNTFQFHQWKGHLGPLLLTWFNFNPSMDK